MEVARVLWNGDLQLLACCSQAIQVMYGRHTAVGSTFRGRNNQSNAHCSGHTAVGSNIERKEQNNQTSIVLTFQYILVYWYSCGNGKQTILFLQLSQQLLWIVT